MKLVTSFVDWANAASLAQPFKAPSPIPQLGSLNSYQCIVFEHMQAGDKNADSAWLKSAHADAKEMMRYVCVAAYRVRCNAT